MRHPTDSFSGIEICIIAVQIWAAFFLVTALVQIGLSDLRTEQFLTVLAGAFAIATIAYQWIRRVDARRHIANLSLLAAGLLIGLDMAVALTDS
jgi:hypothetical protein